MSRARALMLLTAVWLGACEPTTTTTPADSQDFAVLAKAAEGYTEARPERALVFPRDHGAHPDFRIEWWYLTANLQDADGQDYGAQWTLFRSAVRPPGSLAAANPWQSEQVYMAHFALTWPDGHRAFQRYARGGMHGDEARAGGVAEPFAAWLDDWTLASSGPEWLPLEVRATQDDHGMHLVLDTDQPLVPQGKAGFSQKHPNGAGSHYYSQPFLEASGELRISGQSVAVSGKAWLDREWSSQFLQSDQAGWDWFALHLDSGEKLMLFSLRGAPHDGQAGGAYRHGVLISAAGGKQLLDPDLIQLQVLQREHVSGRLLPLAWQIELPEIGRSIRVAALHPNQWMDVDFPYWEGVVTVSGDNAGSRGIGYVELTGYTQ